MKKYIKPAIKAQIVVTENFIAQSPNFYDQQGNGSWHAPAYNQNDVDDDFFMDFEMQNDKKIRF